MQLSSSSREWFGLSDSIWMHQLLVHFRVRVFDPELHDAEQDDQSLHSENCGAK